MNGATTPTGSLSKPAGGISNQVPNKRNVILTEVENGYFLEVQNVNDYKRINYIASDIAGVLKIMSDYLTNE